MNRRLHTLTRAALAAATLAAAPAGRLHTQEPFGHELALATFQAAWQTVYETHFDTTFNGVDWLALREELHPRADSAEDRETLRDVIRDMLARLGQSHFALIPREIADTLDPNREDVSGAVGDLGFEVRYVGDAMVVVRVDSGGPADAAGVRPGWVVEAVGPDRVDSLRAPLLELDTDRPLAVLIWARVAARLQGRPGTEIAIAFRDAEDRAVTLTLDRRPFPGEAVKLGNLPTFWARATARAVSRPDLDLTVGLLWFNYWMAPLMRQLDGAIDQFRDLDGIVIDLRGNGGGALGMIMGMAGHFLDDRSALGVMRARTTELNIAANPRRVSTAGARVTPYAGPVAILTDRLSGSASEVFAGGMQSLGRVRVFGDTTAGGVLPASMDRLPNGDILYHAFAEFETAEGTYLEGRGVFPDQPVPLAREDFLAGRDPVLEAAIAWIAAQREPSP